MFLLIYSSFFENCLFSSLAYLLTELLALFIFNFLDALYILDINPISWITGKSFFLSVDCLFTLLIVSFAVYQLFKFNTVPLVNPCCYLLSYITVLFRKSLILNCLLLYFSTSFKSYIAIFNLFSVDFSVAWDWGSSFGLLNVDI
jgi:hypothetical protein